MTQVSNPSVAAQSAAAHPAAVGAVLTLAANCTVRDGASIKGALAVHYETDEPVALDANQIERIDAAIVQLLCAFARDRKAKQRAVVWTGASAVFKEAVQLLGAAELLSFESAPGAQT